MPSPTLGSVHMRILAGVGAWLLGAGTATAGSLLTVSLLGQGIADSQGQQLTAVAVNRALAREAQESSQVGRQGASLPAAPASPMTWPTAASPSAVAPPTAEVTPSAAPAASQAPPVPTPTVPGGTVLTSQGGTVLAECRPAGAYLVSWSPTQGYEATSVIRGPAATGRVVFESNANSVTMLVSCPGGASGAPVASSYIQGQGGGYTDE